MQYTSRTRVLGLPLVHVAIGGTDGATRGIARGWIAVGDIAFGVLFALGGVAVGGVSVGGASLGVLSVAGAAFGVWALGGLAVGVFALGGAAFAWWAADGGLAVATEFARGGEASARHVNDVEASRYFEGSSFFRVSAWLARHALWLVLLPMLLPVFQRLQQRRRTP